MEVLSFDANWVLLMGGRKPLQAQLTSLCLSLISNVKWSGMVYGRRFDRSTEND